MLVLVLAALAAVPSATAESSSAVQIRGVNLAGFPLVRVTASAPAGSRPTVEEDGRPAAFSTVRELGSAGAIVLAVDNSASMSGRPLRAAKRAAAAFLAQEAHASTAVVAFGHQALPLTLPGAPSTSAARALAALEPDTQSGTSLYDAVELSVARLRSMSDGSRVLVLMTDGHDIGSRSSLGAAVAAVQRAGVVVYAIAVGARVDREPLATLASASGGRLLAANDVDHLTAAYGRVGQELERTWQLSFLTRARPGDRVKLTISAAGGTTSQAVTIPGRASRSQLLPAAVARDSRAAVAVVLLAALLLAAAGAAVRRRHRTSDVVRLLEPHVARRVPGNPKQDRSSRVESVLAWTEASLAGLPGFERLARIAERSGTKLRVGHVPYLAGAAALMLGLIGSAAGMPPFITLLLMLAGLASPVAVLRVAGERRTQAFDRQLPDVLATIASTLRAGHGLRPALRAIADDGTPPASLEFSRVLGEERLGLALDQALAAMCGRIGSQDLEYVATAVRVQSQTGGSLAGLFDTLSATVRERQRHARKVRALTGLGRISAAVLIAMPIGLAGLMTVLSPSYVAPLYTTSGGHVALGICLASVAIGGLMLKRIVAVRY